MGIEFEQATFRGTAYQVEDLDSVSVLFHGEDKRGIYRLSFANGEAYVGLTEDVVGRFADHRRRWDDIVGFEFFPVPGPEPLLAAERILIAETERTCSLRNVVDTKRPRGEKITSSRSARAVVCRSLGIARSERHLPTTRCRSSFSWLADRTTSLPGRSQVGLFTRPSPTR